MKMNVNNYLLFLEKTGLFNNTCYMDEGFDEFDVITLINELKKTHFIAMGF